MQYLRIVSACLLAFSAWSAHADNVVVIGFSGALTGGQAHYGKDNERGAQMALDQINAMHPVIAGVKTTFRLDAEDDAGDPRTATTVAQRFVDQHVSAVVGHQNSGSTIAVARLYAAANIAEVTPSATNPQFTQLGYRTTFRMLANDNFLGQAVARYATEQLHVHRVAVMDDRTAYGQGIADVFVSHIEKAGVNLVARDYTTDKAITFSAPLTLIKGKKPDAIFYGGMDTQGAPMLKQMKQFGIAAPLLGGDGLCTAAMEQLAGAALNGNVFCADGGRSFEKMPGGPALAAAFTKKFGEPMQIYAPYAYDAMMAIYHAIVLEQSTDSAKIVEGLHRIAFDGVSGHIAFDSHGDLQSPVATISTFKHGQKIALTEVSQ